MSLLATHSVRISSSIRANSERRDPASFERVHQRKGATCWAAATTSCLLSFRLPASTGDPDGPEAALAKQFVCKKQKCPPKKWNKPMDVEAVLRDQPELRVEAYNPGQIDETQLAQRLRDGTIAVSRIVGVDSHVVSVYNAVPIGGNRFDFHVYDSLGRYTSQDKSFEWVLSTRIFLVDPV